MLDGASPRRLVVVVVALALAACAPAPAKNTVMGRLPGHSWHGPVRGASICPHCTQAGVITIDLGSNVSLTTTTCFKDAKSNIGITQFDSHVEHAFGGTQVSATEGQLEIEQCSPSHIRATVWAKWPDGGRIDASIDSYLTQAEQQQ